MDPFFKYKPEFNNFNIVYYILIDYFKYSRSPQ